MGTFKTLQEDLEASLIMGKLAGAITFIGSKYVNQNIERFSPDVERKARAEAKEGGEKGNLPGEDHCESDPNGANGRPQETDKDMER